jgi:hypothetical protein
MKVRMAVISLALAFAVAAYAHGDKVHVTGVIDKVTADTVSVKTADGKTVDVKLAPATVYIFRDGKSKDGTPAKVTDLAAGQRVVIHATPKNGTLIADEVKFAAAGEPAHTKPASMKQPKPAGH